MKEIRLCDNHEIEYTIELCKKNKLAIEVQSFSDPYVENKQDIIEKYKKMLPEIKKRKVLSCTFLGFKFRH